jgi:hypothetical protein
VVEEVVDDKEGKDEEGHKGEEGEEKDKEVQSSTQPPSTQPAGRVGRAKPTEDADDDTPLATGGSQVAVPVSAADATKAAAKEKKAKEKKDNELRKLG